MNTHKNIFNFSLAGVLLLLAGMQANIMAAAQQQIEMADALRANGKIYIVVATLFSIMAGIFVYIYRLDRKVAKLEKELDRIDDQP